MQDERGKEILHSASTKETTSSPLSTAQLLEMCSQDLKENAGRQRTKKSSLFCSHTTAAQ